jgi:hypothetical protein
MGRAWDGHAIEDACPCQKEPCGLVGERFNPECPQHGLKFSRTMRSGHFADQCPAKARSDGA